MLKILSLNQNQEAEMILNIVIGVLIANVIWFFLRSASDDFEQGDKFSGSFMLAFGLGMFFATYYLTRVVSYN